MGLMKITRWVHVKNSAICWDGLKNSVGANEISRVEQSELLSNQQETDQKGSSETYTQSSPEQKKIQFKVPTKEFIE